MKILVAHAKRAVAALAIVTLATPLCAQTMHSGERTDDFTGIRRDMSKLRPITCGLNQAPVGNTCVDIAVTPPQPSCGAGSVFSGGSCVAIPQMPASCGAGYVLSGGGCVAVGSATSWTAYFTNQSKSFSYIAYPINILSDGSIWTNIPGEWNNIYYQISPPPYGNSIIFAPAYGGCQTLDLYIKPTFASNYDAMHGGVPNGWTAFLTGLACQSRGGGGPGASF